MGLPQFAEQLAARVTLFPLQIVVEAGEMETAGGGLFVSTTSSVEVQAPFVIVHLNVAVVPAVTPVTPEVGEVGVVMVADPLTTLHAPVPVAGLLAASVNVLVLHLI